MTWNDLLRDCDFEMTANEVRDMLKMWGHEAASKGEEAYYNPEFLAVLYPFLDTPSLDTAIPLLEVAPATYSLFEKCCPGGEFYELQHFLERGPNTQSELFDGRPTDADKQPTGRILVVDDDQAIREIICSMLRSAGYESQAVAGGLDALQLLEAGARFDLLLSDVMNSPMDGITFLECMKKSFPGVPVVIATAINDISVALACARNGADDYIQLPVTRDRLLAVVRHALGPEEKPTQHKE